MESGGEFDEGRDTTTHVHFTGVGQVDPRGQGQRGALPGTVRSDNAENLPRIQVEVDGVEGDEPLHRIRRTPRQPSEKPRYGVPQCIRPVPEAERLPNGPELDKALPH